MLSRQNLSLLVLLILAFHLFAAKGNCQTATSESHEDIQRSAAFVGAADATDGAPHASEADISNSVSTATTDVLQMLLRRVTELEAEVEELMAERKNSPAVASNMTTIGTAPSATSSTTFASVLPTPAVMPIEKPPSPSPGLFPPSPKPQETGGHTMNIPGGGPSLSIRGFLDFNFGLGSVANPLIYPLTIPSGPVHNTFQFGEVDLFMTSKLSDSLSFLSEAVFGSDASNFWGIDVERAQLTYKPSDYFQISAGRFHTSIGYYNTAFHHGLWFQTATGRPFMDFFEDSGGILPVHSVGISATGLVPRSGKSNVHWIVEVGNGTSSLVTGQPIVNEPVQNFLSDKNHKAFNLAAYFKPDWVPGLQIGASYYNDVRIPPGAPNVHQNIESFYVVYTTPVWEFLNELVDQRDKSVGSGHTYNTPLGYTQISRKFRAYRPYFRWQYVNVPSNDPLYSSVGLFQGPSVGLRMDFTDYVALKIQYNRVYTRDAAPKNGIDSQVAFTF